MEAERGVLRVMPGDKIEWEVEIDSTSRLRDVWAIFIEEDEDTNPVRLVLKGDVYRFERKGDRRVNLADLSFSREHSDQLQAISYRLATIGGTTSSGSVLNVPPDTLPEVYISIQSEPENEVLALGNSRLRVR